MPLLKKINAFFNPEQYQGWGRQRNYFEGWYIKIVNADESSAFAVIPGIAMDKAGNQQAFIQVLDGRKKTAVYHRFDASDFQPAPGRFYLSILENSFSEKHITLDLPEIKGSLHFSGNKPWPKKLYSPGIMGPYAFAPFMECYHGIVSLDHEIDGELILTGGPVSFTGGRGYMEKDWGHSFPAAYFWMQSNHFTEPGVSFKASVAKIPWLRKSFTGFIGGLWLQDRLFKFTTYNGSRLLKSFADEKKVELVIQNRKYRIEVFAHRQEGTELAAPIGGLMDGKIEESMTANLEVVLRERKSNTILFADTGRSAGLEVAGSIHELFV